MRKAGGDEEERGENSSEISSDLPKKNQQLLAVHVASKRVEGEEGGRGRGRGKTPPKPVPVLNKNMKRPAAAEIPPAKKTKKQEAVRTKKDHAFGFSLVCNACFSVISS